VKRAALAYLEGELAKLQEAHLLRRRPERRAWRAPSFSSNDYLGLAARAMAGEALSETASGAGASRLVTGEHGAHKELEGTVVDWLRPSLGCEDAVSFASGYAANVGTLAALAGPGDLVVSDALNHASIIDGIRLSRASVVVTPHLDVGAVERALRHGSFRRAWVVVESYYSMDADSPDLRALRTICDGAGAALVVDEAHAFGVVGPEGRGLCAELGVVPDVWVGTLGKALGAQGGIVVGTAELALWLWNRARSFVFSTGLSPAVAAVAARNARWIRTAEAARASVAARARALREGLRDQGLDVRGTGHVVPWRQGSPEQAARTAEALREAGFEVQAIRPPTVPEGTSRIRFGVTAAHEPAHVDALLATIADLSRRAR
jgi:8-amino-7-oxononanoate synthase